MAIAAVHGAPVIEFEAVKFDFGKITSAKPMSGVFKFKNTGDAVLNITEVMPSCDCTVAKANPTNVAPGASGEIVYTIKMDHEIKGQRHVDVHSNDPQKEDVQLNVDFDYTPLYQALPVALQISLPAGKDAGLGTFIVSRADGKALAFDKMTASEPWISVENDPTFEPPAGTGFDVSLEPVKSSARYIVKVHRPSLPPGLINATVDMWNSNLTKLAVCTVKVAGEIEGEFTAKPARFYWPLADHGKDIKDFPPETLIRHVELKSMLGKPVEIKRVSTDIKGLSVKAVPKEAGVTFDLQLKLEELPATTVQGKITVETSLASVPIIEVPVTIAPPY